MLQKVSKWELSVHDVFSFSVAGTSKHMHPYLDQAPLFGEVTFFGAQLKKKEAPSEAQNYHMISVFLFLSRF